MTVDYCPSITNVLAHFLNSTFLAPALAVLHVSARLAMLTVLLELQEPTLLSWTAGALILGVGVILPIVTMWMRNRPSAGVPYSPLGHAA